MIACVRSIHDLLCPIKLVSTGNLNRSSMGAHKNLMAYIIPTHPNIVISEILTSAEASQSVSVANKSGWGRPAENPKKTILIDSELV